MITVPYTFRTEMDRFEAHALQLELEQKERYERAGRHSDFWSSRYEEFQSFLISRYRKQSATWGKVFL